MIKNRGKLQSEQGGTFILVLLAILVLTFLGLSLAVVTETEMTLGANIQSINRTYFSAESGLAAAVAAVMTTNDWCGESFLVSEREIGDPSGTNNLVLGYRVETTPVEQIGRSFPPLSNANWGERRHYTFFVRTSASAQRVAYLETEEPEDVIKGTTAGDLTLESQRVATTSMLLSPLETPPLQQFNCAREVAAADS